jgi:hypothetical protein
MDFLVTVPDNADPKTIDSLESSIEAAGGTWEPMPGPEEMEPGLEEGALDPAASMAAGPGAGFPSPGAALSGAGARALRPR